MVYASCENHACVLPCQVWYQLIFPGEESTGHPIYNAYVMGDYRYHELRPLISYFPCNWVVPVDFPNTCPMKIVNIFYRIIARYGRDIYTLSQYFSNQQWYNKSTYDLVERLLFPLSFYRQYIRFKRRYSDVSKFRMIFNLIYLSSI